MIRSDHIRACLQAIPYHDVEDGRDSGRLPVLFAAAEGCRFIGYAAAHWQADNLAIAARLSATYTSRAQVAMADGRMSAPFFILHGGAR